MVAQLEVSCWACHAMHKVVALASSWRPHWPVGGFQQCGVCVLTSCCSLSVVRLCFVLRAGLLVSFPERMVSCKLGSALVLHPSDFCEVKYFLQCLLLQYFANVRIFLFVCSGRLVHHMIGLLVSRPEGKVSCRREHVLGAGLGLNAGFHRLKSALGQCCMGRRFSSQLQAVAACLLVALLGGMGSCRLGLALVLCPSSCGGCSSLQRWLGCMRRRIPWLRRWSFIMDQTDVCCVHGSGRPFCCRCVAGLALPALGRRTPVCLSWCP